MVVRDNLSDLLNHVVNCKKAGKFSCEFVPISKFIISVIELMKKEGYIKNFEVEENKRGGKISIEIGKLNYCKAIKPRFNVKRDGYDKFVRRFLISRNFGVLVVGTSKGLMTHTEAEKQNLGGKLIAYCY